MTDGNKEAAENENANQNKAAEKKKWSIGEKKK